jgi:sterol desaturase/sphingolipid hydroxylase (fatty acid hydroxylase superfamily)
MEWLTQIFEALVLSLFEVVVQPTLFASGLAHLAEPGYDASRWFVIGVIEVVVLGVLLGAAQRVWPAEPVVDRQTIRTDVAYTLLHRLGLFALVMFAIFQPWLDALKSNLTLAGFTPLQPDRLLPGFTDQAIVSFLIYLIILDFVDYWVHRAQHRWQWWWQLHSLHHAQRQMTLWSDQRNHLLDDLIRDLIFAVIALLIGVAPAQFVGLIVLSRSLQTLQHANVRWRFGSIGERLVVSPSFHRLHHGIGVGHEGRTFGQNFAVLFPIWDVLFRTANFAPGFVPTGVSDQLQGRNYGQGFWQQQWFGLKRLFRVELGHDRALAEQSVQTPASTNSFESRKPLKG